MCTRDGAEIDMGGEALGAVGLVDYPTECGHWPYGDRYRALATGAGNAVFGPWE